jgi:glycosyltransferase involved in cell wall biosynthesis
VRAVVDLQACQTRTSRTRGIGRYSRSFALGLAGSTETFDLSICLNSAFPDSTEELSRQFEPLVGEDNVVRYDASRPPARWTATALDAGRVRGEWVAQYAWIARQPDLIHISSIFEGLDEDSAVPELLGLPQTTVVSATVYDLIPLLLAETYLRDRIVRDGYLSRVDRLTRCDLLLAISEATRRDVATQLGFPADRIATIHAAVDGRFRPGTVTDERRHELLGRLKLTKPFVMYTGGIDHRKNVEATIRAFGLLPDHMRAQRQLAIICSISAHDRERLERLIRSCRLPHDSVVLTGYVSDNDLLDLYRCCELFVFPSRYEGFGLPVLEAMSSGAPTIVANASSLPEIVARADALFSIDSDERIAEALARVLGDVDFLDELRRHGLERAALYSWKHVADRAREAWTEALSRKREAIAIGVRTKPRLAIVSPLLPERSGIADFVTEFLPYLAEHFRIDLFVSQEADARKYASMGFGVRAWQSLPATWSDYDAGVLYQFGNSEFHAHMLALLEICPGTVLLHDAYLSGLIAFVAFERLRTPRFFYDMLAYAHGPEAMADAQRLGIDDAIERRPIVRWIADRATGMFVTSAHAKELLEHDRQLGCTRCSVLRHPRAVRIVTAVDRARARDRLGIPQSAYIVCSLGYVSDRKRSIELIEAWAGLKCDSAARLVFVGETDSGYGESFRRAVARSTKASDISVTGYVSDDDFLAYVTAADVVVQLRKSSRGEASGAALHAMAHGVPLVASRHGSLAEIPDAACMHVADPLDAEELVAVLARLAAEPDTRAALGRRGQDWVRAACDPAAIARAIAADLASFNDIAIAHRDTSLAARADAFSMILPEGRRLSWVKDLRARTAEVDPRLQANTVAASISRAVARLRSSSVASGDEVDAPPVFGKDKGTLSILADDPRLHTNCGSRNATAIVTSGRDGFLVYGPYLAIAPGRYRVRVFGTQTPGAANGSATLEIACDGGKRRLAACAISGASDVHRDAGMIVRLDFSADRGVPDLEVRIMVSSETRMAVESIDLVGIGD